MGWLSTFVTNYLFENPLFLWLHAANAAVAYLLLRTQTRRAVHIRATIAEQKELSPGVVRMYTVQLERFETYLDLCASCFIFIGLIGTISGFSESFSHGSKQLNLGALARALSTSAFGIIWSLALNSIASWLHHRRIAPVVDELHERQSRQDIGEITRETLLFFEGRIADAMRELAKSIGHSLRRPVEELTGCIGQLRRRK